MENFLTELSHKILCDLYTHDRFYSAQPSMYIVTSLPIVTGSHDDNIHHDVINVAHDYP